MPYDEKPAAEEHIIRWIDGRVFPIRVGTPPAELLPSAAGLFLSGPAFTGPIWKAEIADWLSLIS
jgi:hypothetical protein